jgi:hypothetical protein
MLVIVIGVVFIIVAVKDNLQFVMTEIKAIGTTGQTSSSSPLTPPGCIDAKTGRSVPCISQNSLNSIQQNLVNV